MTSDFDFIVIGAGMVGAALGYGLAGLNQRVLMLDGADTDFRAAKANFGLVWAQSKGAKDPSYRRLTISAVRAWPNFASALEEESGLKLAYEQHGGLSFCLSDDELASRAALLDRWNAQTPESAPLTAMLDRNELRRRYPSMRLGSDVAGASFCELDGQVNPLRLLAALQTAFIRRGGLLRSNHPVTSIELLPGGGFQVNAGASQAHAKRVVIAAGLGSTALGEMVGLKVPIRPQRGQLLVTERLEPLIPLAVSSLRQNAEGTVMIGVTQEEVGYDLATTTDAASRLARRALRILPDLAHVKLVRQWACLRIMTPDGSPIFASSGSHAGADIIACHSGVTLSSIFAGDYAKALAAGGLSGELKNFHHERFNVQKAA